MFHILKRFSMYKRTTSAPKPGVHYFDNVQYWIHIMSLIFVDFFSTVHSVVSTQNQNACMQRSTNAISIASTMYLLMQYACVYLIEEKS